MANDNSSDGTQPGDFPSAVACVTDPHSGSGRVAREMAYLESLGQVAATDTRIGGLEFRELPGDRLMRRLDQARAMLQLTIGELGQDFNRANDSIRENYLWTVADLVDAALGDAFLLTGLDKEPTTAEGRVLGP